MEKASISVPLPAQKDLSELSVG